MDVYKEGILLSGLISDNILLSAITLSDGSLPFDFDSTIYFIGGHFSEILIGGDGIDTLIAHNGNDLLGGCPGDDHLEGGSGNDRLEGGPGIDTIYGGVGADCFSYEEYCAGEVKDFNLSEGDYFFPSIM